MKVVTIAVPNAILFVQDPTNRGVSIPAWSAGSLVASNATCISVATIGEVDGEVEVGLAGHVDPAAASGASTKVFEGPLDTPGRKITIVASDGKAIADMEVPGTRTRVAIWINRTDFPSLIRVVAG